MTTTDDRKEPSITEIAQGATPKNIKAWIESLETMYGEKKSRVRKELQEKVLELVSSNGYTLEELFGARILPTTSELAERARLKDLAMSNQKDKLMDSATRA
jgi:hypothetical protein